MYQDHNNKEIPINESRNSYFDDINADTYRIEYGIKNQNGEIFEPKVLKGIKLIPEVQINGKKIPIDEKTGTVKLTKGDAKILVQIRYNDVKLGEETITGKILDERPCWVTFIDILIKYKVLLMVLFSILLALLLYWLLWGTKKKFPMREMATSPVITKDSGGEESQAKGSFTRNKSTLWMPFCAQEGNIRFVPRGFSFPQLRVKAKDNYTMILMNAGSFKPEKHRSTGAEVQIGSLIINEETKDREEISCTATIVTKLPSGDRGPETVYTCSLARSRK